MDVTDVVKAIKSLPETKVAQLFNVYDDCWCQVYENIDKNLNRIFAEENPSEVIDAVVQAGGDYSGYHKWVFYGNSKLRSANTLKDLIPYYEDTLQEIAQSYLDEELWGGMTEIIDAAVGKEIKDKELEAEIQAEKLRKDGESRLASLLRVMKDRGEQNLIDRCLADDDFRLSCYNKYHMLG